LAIPSYKQNQKNKTNKTKQNKTKNKTKKELATSFIHSQTLKERS